jgi:hypothetical protein
MNDKEGIEKFSGYQLVTAHFGISASNLILT